MAVPKKKVARSKSSTRHSAYMKKNQKRLVNIVSLVECKNCGEKKMAHMACKNCGFFKGREVITKKKAQVTKIQA